MGGGDSSSSSSGEEDGDAGWRAAIDSVATTGFGNSVTNEFNTKSNDSTTDAGFSVPKTDVDLHDKQKPQNLKLYQIKAQKLLEDLLDKSLEMVRNPIPILQEVPVLDEGGIRLFRQAPPGIVFDAIDEFQQPRKRPKILPGEAINEKSKKFRGQLQSVAVDGLDIMAAARDACQKSLARFEAKIAATKTASKQEEERIAELKRIRGEKWLPSIAREMQLVLDLVGQ